VRSIEHANLIDAETLAYMNERDVWLSPQVVVFQQEMGGMNADQLAKQRQARDGVSSLLTAANNLGYRNIVFGTDIVTSLSELRNGNRELVLRSEWFEPAEVLKQATSKAGKLVGLSGPRNPYGKLGVIEPLAVADILLVDGDPLEDISILARPQESIRVIIKGGEIYKNEL
jgi:imidazolonepropionase-like amidohydrolase